MASELLVFKNREEAGKQLADQLSLYKMYQPLVLALSGEGCKVAKEVIRGLGTNLFAPHYVETVILVDDGGTALLDVIKGIELIKDKYNPSKIIFASPVCARENINVLKLFVNDVVYINAPLHVPAIRNWYEDFEESKKGYFTTSTVSKVGISDSL
jgi:predicted phosphoribosyltransferase